MILKKISRRQKKHEKIPRGQRVKTDVFFVLVPAEKGVLSKERSSGAYRLSAYYFAKMTSDLPLTFILPTVMFTLLFFLAGLGGAAEFFLSLLVIYLQVLISQVSFN